MLFLRERPATTLNDVLESVGSPQGKVVLVDSADVRFHLGGDTPSVRLGDGVEVYAGPDTLTAMAAYAALPTKWLLRQEALLQEHIFAAIYGALGVEVNVRYEPHKIYEMWDAEREGSIEPRSLIEIAAKVLGGRAEVVYYSLDQIEFRLDAIVPRTARRGIGGDKEEGDTTRAGLRMGMNRKRNLAPWVQPLFYRIPCTNGMEVPSPGLRVDARGLEVDQILVEIETRASWTLGAADKRIEHFYALRDQKVADPVLLIRRVGMENGIPARTVDAIVALLPEYLEDESSASLFEVVNVITNYANEESIRSRETSSRALEIAGGAIVSEAIERCGQCQAKLLAPAGV